MMNASQALADVHVKLAKLDGHEARVHAPGMGRPGPNVGGTLLELRARVALLSADGPSTGPARRCRRACCRVQDGTPTPLKRSRVESGEAA